MGGRKVRGREFFIHFEFVFICLKLGRVRKIKFMFITM